MTTTIDGRARILGSLLGGAIGDALGAAIEFDSTEQIRRAHGPDGLTTYAPAYGRVAAMTDDTQMTLFTAEGLLRWRAHATDGARDTDDAVASVARAYARWLVTQGGTGPTDGWLLTNDVLHVRRSPGNTCLSALHAGRMGTTAEPVNDSKGCGGVMRAAPAGLVARGEGTFRLGADCAAITHGHPTGYLAAGAFAAVIGQVMTGDALPDAIATARAELVRHPHHDETVRAVDAAVALAARGVPTPEDLETLGGGWVAEEALAIGLCCALVARDVRHGLLLAVNHGGDSDSTGSIAGNLLGAMHGVDALPQDLLAPLEARELIEQIGHDLADVFVDGRGPDPDRYPPG